jgi:iron complex outermembrane receptor protein
MNTSHARHETPHVVGLRVASLSAILLSLAVTPRARGQTPPAATAPAPAAAPVAAIVPASTPYKKMDLDELMDVQVTTVSKRASTVGESAAAVTVITQDDITRSGATSIPEALRMAPGLEVAQIDSSTWAISARGFNNNTANKLLVLMDGRSVYTPLFSGVYWDVQDTMMQDIDRIEVIRGPAGSLWGSNAVNGVINVITKDSRDTQGLLLTGGGGTEERDFAAMRYGWSLGPDLTARVYAKHFERDDSDLPTGKGSGDAWFMSQTGFRMDWHPPSGDQLTLQGDAYDGTRGNGALGNTDLSGGNLLGRWSQNLGQGDLKLQMYYDGTRRNIPYTYGETRNTFDVDFQYHLPIGIHDLTAGLGYRWTGDNIINGANIQFTPDHRMENLYSAFIQDEIQLVPDRLRLTLGSKVEHNDFTGFEFQPSARLLWTIDKRQSAWAAVSRAVRTPTQLEEDLRIVVGPVSFDNDRNFKSEVVLAYEAGYRVEPVNWLSLDIAAFYNQYQNLSSVETAGFPHLAVGNGINGQTYGVEVGTTVQATDWWTIHAANTYLEEQLQKDPTSSDLTSLSLTGSNPQFQSYVRSSMKLGNDVDLDLSVRYVSELASQNVPGYFTADARLAWRPNSHLELAVVGQNLFDNRHPEFITGGVRHEIDRGVFGQLTYHW